MHGLTVAGVLLRYPRPQQQVGAGQFIGVGGEVLGTHTTLLQPVDLLPAQQCFRQRRHILHQSRIVLQRRGRGQLLHLCAAPEGRGNALRQLADALHDPGRHRPVKGTDRPLQHRLIGDDVGSLSRLKPTHRHHRRGFGRKLPAGDLLQGQPDLGGDADGVHARLRHGPVATLSPHRDAEQGTARHEGPAAAQHRSGGGAGVDVEGQRLAGGRSLQDSCRQHGLGAGEALLVRLEHQLHRAGELLPALHQQLGRTQQHGSVHIVAAGVHTAVFRPEGQARLLLSPEGVHIRPQQDAASGVSSGDGGGQAAAQLLRMVSHLRQPPLDIGHRLRQNRPGLRVPVQAATIRRQLRLHGLRLPA